MSLVSQKSLFDILQEKLPLGPKNSRGWYELRCAVCNDHSPRFGIYHDGTYTSCHCWNCGVKAKYEEGTGKLSRSFRQVLEAFGITKNDLVELRSTIFNQAKAEETAVTLDALKKVKLVTPEVALPDNSYPIGHELFPELQLPLASYLERRKVDPLKVKAHFSLDPRMLGRVIIPFYRAGKVIYWQARHIEDGVKPRYLNSYCSRDAVLYGYDELVSWKSTPIFVTEGVFDAIVLDGVCTLGSSINAAKLEVLRRCRRRLIFVVDRDKTGGEFGATALENGWEVTFVDERVKDANQSVQQHGLAYTIYTLLSNATAKPAYPDQSRLQLALGVTIGKLRRSK